MRRAERQMPQERAVELLRSAYCGRVATVGADGEPYVCPLLFVWREGEIWFHTSAGSGHLRRNVDHEPRACFEVAMPGQVFPYGRFDCDTALECRSVIA